jgi:hypothetical protein
MSERHRTITVILDDDYRYDDLESTLNTLKQIKGVRDAVLGDPLQLQDKINRTAILHEFTQNLRCFANAPQDPERWKRVKAALE